MGRACTVWVKLVVQPRFDLIIIDVIVDFNWLPAYCVLQISIEKNKINFIFWLLLNTDISWSTKLISRQLVSDLFA